MSDRSSAYIFGRVFEMIADEVHPDTRDRVAAQFWKMSREFDFSEDQMHADEALKKLGYLRTTPSAKYPDEVDYDYGPAPNGGHATGEGVRSHHEGDGRGAG